MSDNNDTELPQASPGSTIEDKLNYILDNYGVRKDRDPLWTKESLASFKAELQAIITTETTKARIDELLSADDTIRLHGVEAWQDYFTNRLNALQKEQKGN